MQIDRLGPNCSLQERTPWHLQSFERFLCKHLMNFDFRSPSQNIHARHAPCKGYLKRASGRGDSKAKFMIAWHLDEYESMPAAGRANICPELAAVNVIPVQFIVDSPLPFPVKQNTRPTSMKAALNHEEPWTPFLSRAAAQTKAAEPPPRPASTSLPPPATFADLMREPEKFAAALLAAKRENDMFAASRLSLDQRAAKKTARPAQARVFPAGTVPEGADGINRNGKTRPTGASRTELTDVEFSIEAPAAESVRLAADFTDWEKCALDMLKAPDGTWLTSVPLSPGSYAYRFIVDGEWRDDPRAAASSPNPFGTVNAVKNVA